jgi:hypothetical protein
MNGLKVKIEVASPRKPRSGNDHWKSNNNHRHNNKSKFGGRSNWHKH